MGLIDHLVCFSAMRNANANWCTRITFGDNASPRSSAVIAG